MNCPFTHTSCDKECVLFQKECLLLKVVKDAKSTRSKAKSPSKEKRVRKAKD